jgi:hypothetical protein
LFTIVEPPGKDAKWALLGAPAAGIYEEPGFSKEAASA